MSKEPNDIHTANPPDGSIRRVVMTTIIVWVVTLGAAIPLSFAHHPVMDAAAPVAGPLLLVVLLVVPFVCAALAGQITHGDRSVESNAAPSFRTYLLAALYRLRWMLALSLGLAPMTLIVLFYRAPDIPFADSIQLWQEGLLLLPFIGLLALRPLLGAALGVWCGMRFRSRWLAVLGGPLLLLVVLGLELGLERLRVIASEPIVIGDTIEYPDVRGLQTAITAILIVDGLSAIAIFLLLLFGQSVKPGND